MSATQLKRLAGVVLALLVVWGAARLLPHGKDRMLGGLSFPVMTADSLDTIVVTAGPQTMVVTRVAAGRWLVNGLPAAPSAVTQFIAAFTLTAEPELVAQNRSSFARMGVDSTAAYHLRAVHGARTLIDVIVSEHGPDFESAFVRRPGDSAVYVVTGGLSGLTRRGLDDWRDKTVATVEPDSVQAISFERNGKSLELRRAGGGWRFASGAAADSGAVRALLDRWRTVMATGFPTAAQVDSTFRGRIRRRATLSAGRTPLVALEFDSTGSAFWVRRSGTERSGVFRMNRWDVEQLVPADSLLRPRKR